jgi:hypothetical protein
MVTLQFKTTLILLFLGFLCGVTWSALLSGCGGSAGSAPPDRAIIEITAKAADNEKTYRSEKAKLDSMNGKLQTELKTTRSLLAQAKQKAFKSKTILVKRIEPAGFPAGVLLKKSNQQSTVDTLSNRCDSLLVELTHYQQDNEIKDSLYEKQISILDSVVVTQDAIIKNDSVAYRDIKGLFDQAIERSTILQNENWQLKHTIRRQKIRGRWATVGLVLLSGAAAHFIANH